MNKCSKCNTNKWQILDKVCRFTGKRIHLKRCIECTKRAAWGMGAFGDRIKMEGWTKA